MGYRNGVETADSPATTLSVTTATAPAVTEPVLSFTGVSSSAFTVSWPAQSPRRSLSARGE